MADIGKPVNYELAESKKEKERLVNTGQILILTSILIFIGVAIVWYDNRRFKRSLELNEHGLCARCGAPLDKSAEPIQIFTRAANRQGKACPRCASISKKQQYIAFSLIGIFWIIFLVSWFLSEG